MIQKSISLEVFKCLECNAVIVCNPSAHGRPAVCDKCGVPANVELTQEQRTQMERMQQQGPRVHTIRF